MRIINPSIQELVQNRTDKSDMLKHIELCGRTCYKSEDRITDDSYVRFVKMLKEHAHGAMLEHGTVYLTVPHYNDGDDDRRHLEYQYMILLHNKFSKTVFNMDDESDACAYITTNYRVIVENNLYDIMDKYQVLEPTEHHETRRTFKITCNRGVSHEFVRHRVFSFAQESQRYVNYSKDKFGNEIKVIQPLYFTEGSHNYWLWEKACKEAEAHYFALLSNGTTPQEAREVLPNSTATELIMTGFESDWEHFFSLRCAKDAHPQAREVANMIKEKFEEKNKWLIY